MEDLVLTKNQMLVVMKKGKSDEEVTDVDFEEVPDNKLIIGKFYLKKADLTKCQI